MRLEDPEALTPGDGERIRQAGRRTGYDLLSLRTSAPLTLDGFAPRGVLTTLEAEPAAVGERLRVAPGRTPVRTLAASDWPEVLGLLRWAAPTRFSADPRIPAAAAREHKLAMLRAYAERSPDNALVALGGDPERVVGFHLSYLDGRVAVLYEIIVEPAHRHGFAAVDLLAENCRRLASGGGLRRLSTRIYSDNTPSIRLFEGIGMRQTGRQEHYFHAWL